MFQSGNILGGVCKEFAVLPSWCCKEFAIPPRWGCKEFAIPVKFYHHSNLSMPREIYPSELCSNGT